MHALEPESYFGRLERAIQRSNERMIKYLEAPTADNVHDVRTSIRRLDAAFKVLPKSIRQKPKVRNFVIAHKKFFDTNSQIRDFDIISAKINSNGSILEIVKRKKEKRLKAAQRQARKAASLKIPNINFEEISAQKLEKRFSKISVAMVDRIQDLMPQVVESQKNVAELHELRKDCKKLRYLLELTSDAEASNLVKQLRQIQDSLGAIHDIDITVDFLKKLPARCNAEEIIRGESSLRAVLYQKFVQEYKSFAP